MHSIDEAFRLVVIISIVLHAAVGWWLVWNMRDDEAEKFLGLVLKRNAWQVLTLLFDAALMWFYGGFEGIEQLRVLAAVALAAWMWSYAHGPMLSPPWQPCSSTPDCIERALMWAFGKNAGDVMGWSMWLLYRACRYVAPCVGIGFCLDYPIVGAIMGVAICVGYWPVAYWIASGERTKFYGAGIAGAVFHVGIFVGAQLS